MIEVRGVSCSMDIWISSLLAMDGILSLVIQLSWMASYMEEVALMMATQLSVRYWQLRLAKRRSSDIQDALSKSKAVKKEKCKLKITNPN